MAYTNRLCLINTKRKAIAVAQHQKSFKYPSCSSEFIVIDQFIFIETPIRAIRELGMDRPSSSNSSHERQQGHHALPWSSYIVQRGHCEVMIHLYYFS